MGPGEQFQALHVRAVPGDQAVVGPVQPDDLGEHVGVAGGGLRPRRGVPFPIPGRGHRFDREPLVAGRDQRRDPRAAVGRDPHDHRGGGLPGAGIGFGIGQVLGEHLVQPHDPADPLGQPGLPQPPPGLVADLHIVMVLSPVAPDEQHPQHLLAAPTSIGSEKETCQRPHGPVLTATPNPAATGHVIPSAITPPHGRPGARSEARTRVPGGESADPAGRHQHRACTPQGRPDNPHCAKGRR